MKKHFKKKFYILTLLSLFTLSCDTYFSRKILISEPLQNQENFNKKSFDHDNNCKGYFKNHFDFNIIDNGSFEEDNLTKLINRTGLKWRIIDYPDNEISFEYIFKKRLENKVVYVAEQVYSEFDTTKIISIGSDDGFSFYLNGNFISKVHKGRALNPNDEFYKVNLVKGSNTLLFKVENGFGDFGLYRKFLTNKEIQDFFKSEVNKLYADLPESCILNDSVKVLTLKPDLRRKFDSIHNLTINWKEVKPFGKVLDSFVYTTNSLPKKIPLPKKFEGKAILEVIVSQKNGKINFREEIPVFYESIASNLSKELTQNEIVSKNSIYIARKTSVKEVFKLNEFITNKTSYSTRFRAQVLLDLFRFTDSKNYALNYHSGAQIVGYRDSKNSTVNIYRVFIPSQITKQKNKYPLLFIFPVRYNKKGSRFWQTGEGRSHSLLVKRTSCSTKYQSVIVLSHYKGFMDVANDAREEIPLITEQLKNELPIDTTKIALFATSDSSLEVWKLLLSKKIPLSHLGLSMPYWMNEKDSNDILRKIKEMYPNLKIFIKHGALDKKAPCAMSRKWAKRLESIGLKVKYIEEKYGTHDFTFSDTEEEFTRFVNETN